MTLVEKWLSVTACAVAKDSKSGLENILQLEMRLASVLGEGKSLMKLVIGYIF